MSATGQDGTEEQDEEMADAQPAAAAPKEEEGEQSMIREGAIGKGASPSKMLHCIFCCLCVAVHALYANVYSLL